MKTSTFDMPGLLGLAALVAVLALGTGSAANAACSGLTDKYINSSSILKKLKADIGNCSNPDKAKKALATARDTTCTGKAHGAKATWSCRNDAQMVHDQLCGNDKLTDKAIAKLPLLSAFNTEIGHCSDLAKAEKTLTSYKKKCAANAHGRTIEDLDKDENACKTDLQYLCYRKCSKQ